MSAQQQTLKRTREDDVVVQPASERGKKLYMPNDFDKVSTVITDELKIKKDESGKMVDQTLMPKTGSRRSARLSICAVCQYSAIDGSIFDLTVSRQQWKVRFYGQRLQI